jgi:hypothetical protein
MRLWKQIQNLFIALLAIFACMVYTAKLQPELCALLFIALGIIIILLSVCHVLAYKLYTSVSEFPFNGQGGAGNL